MILMLYLSFWMNDLIIGLTTAILILGTIFIPKFLEEHHKISKFTARKLIHSFSGLGVFITPYLNYPIIAGILAGIMTLITRTSGRKSPTKIQQELFEAIGEEEEETLGYLQGPYAYCLAITILVFAFLPLQKYYYFPIAAILIMMYSDTLAAFIGKKYGKHSISIKWVGNKRTIEGSLTFFVSALVISYGVFSILGLVWPGNLMMLTKNSTLILSLIMSTTSTLLELISPSKYDDIIVPIGATIIISLSAFLLGYL